MLVLRRRLATRAVSYKAARRRLEPVAVAVREGQTLSDALAAVRGFPGAVEPYLRIWKDHPDQVRYDTPIPVDVEAAAGLPADRYPEVARAIERELRTRLQIRVDVTILDPETLPRTTYKTPLLHVRQME